MHQVLLNVLCDISKLLVIRNFRQQRFGAKRTEIGKKSRKMGKLFSVCVILGLANAPIVET